MFWQIEKSGVFSRLTFVFVAFGFDTEAGHDHDDYNDHNSGQTHQKPIFAVERFGSIIPSSQVPLGRSGYLWKKAPSLFSSRQFSFFRARILTKDLEYYNNICVVRPKGLPNTRNGLQGQNNPRVLNTFASFKKNLQWVLNKGPSYPFKKCIGQRAIKSQIASSKVLAPATLQRLLVKI